MKKFLPILKTIAFALLLVVCIDLGYWWIPFALIMMMVCWSKRDLYLSAIRTYYYAIRHQLDKDNNSGKSEKDELEEPARSSEDSEQARPESR